MEQKQEDEEEEKQEEEEKTTALLGDDSPSAFIPPLDTQKEALNRRKSKRTSLEVAIDELNETKMEKGQDSVEYQTRRATLEMHLEAVNEAARKAAEAVQAVEIHQKKSSIMVKKTETPPSIPPNVKLLKQQISVPLYKVKIHLSREQKWERYLQLPMKSTIPNGNVAHDKIGLRRGQWQSAIYMTVRQFQYESSDPHHINPHICLIINPESKLIHGCFSIMDMGKCCDEQYPKIVEMLYETFLEFDIHEETRYRPAMIMVDDPLLAICLRRELEGYDDTVGKTNTTVIKLVYDDQELIPTTASTEDLSLSRLCRSNYAFIRQVTVLFLREHGHKTVWGKRCHISKETMTAVLSGTENGVDMERDSNEIVDTTSPSSPTTLSSSLSSPLILKACICCGILYPHIRRCSGCYRRLQTNYCSSDCSLRHWKIHKEVCDEQVWSFITLI